jgi:lysozyme
MRTSPAGIKLITEFEGFPNGGRPYNDPVGFATVGYGHLIARRRVADEDRKAIWMPGQKRPGVLTQAEARTLLKRDLAVRERHVEQLARVQLSQGQFDALVSFTFNVGEGNVERSTVLRKLNAGDNRGAADAFMMWNKGDNPLRVLAGLTRRREAERALFLAHGGNGGNGGQVAEIHFTDGERKAVPEYDRLVRQGGDAPRLATLRDTMTRQRKRIFHRAQPGGDGRGWDYADRRRRYLALRKRTK